MFEYIKRQVNAQRSANAVKSEAVAPSDVPNDVITEYAHLFQELSDLTDEGTEAGKERKLDLDIDLAGTGDSEVDKIEFDLNTNTVDDVPGDATAASIAESSYETMKTYDKFYAEAAAKIPRLARESDDAYSKRVSKLADKLYEEYCVDAEEIGAFGFTKMDVTDNKVPNSMIVNFGSIGDDANTAFCSKVPVFYAVDDNRQITKKQLDSARLIQSGAFKNIGNSLSTYMESNYDVPANKVWEACTPINLYIPTGDGDSFCAVLEYTNEITGKNEYFGWTKPVVVQESADVINQMEKVNMESFLVGNYLTPSMALTIEQKEAAMTETAPKKKPSRFYQEELDFGGGDAGSDTDNAGGDPPPLNDGADQATGGDASTDAASGDNSQPAADDASKETAAVNDVSSEIAEKVADQTQQDANENENEEITFPDETGDNSSVSFDDNTGDTSTGDEVASADDQLDDLDTSGGESEFGDEGSDEGIEGEDDGSIDNGETDIENMSMEEIMNNASDKLKNMPLSELKEFLNSGSPEDFQEALIYTSKNINNAVDNHLHKALGILNDNKMNIDKLLRKFKLEGHELNRILVKAAKMTKVYSSDECEEIKKLNSTLADLRSSLKKSNDASYVSSVKRKIEAFTKQSKVVAAFVEDKKEKPVQESFLLSNINDKLTKAFIPVKGQMETLKKFYDEGNLTRGRLRRMYMASGVAGSGGDGTGVNYGGTSTKTLSAKRSIWTGITEYAAELNKALTLCNKALKKKNVDNIELIATISDKLDLISDYIETILDSSIENSEMLKRIGMISGELITLIDEFIGTDDSVSGVEPDNAIDTTEEGISDTTEEPVSNEDAAVEETPTDDEDVTEGTDSDEEPSFDEEGSDSEEKADNEDEEDED